MVLLHNFGLQYGRFMQFITQSKYKQIVEVQDVDNVKEKDR